MLASKNVASQTRGANGKDNKQNIRTVGYSCLFTRIDPFAPEGDNACFILFGQGPGGSLDWMTYLKVMDNSLVFCLFAIHFFLIIYNFLTKIYFELIYT